MFPGACYTTAYVMLTDSNNLKVLKQNMAIKHRGGVYNTPAQYSGGRRFKSQPSEQPSRLRLGVFSSVFQGKCSINASN
jgi:hypothetical protein